MPQREPKQWDAYVEFVRARTRRQLVRWVVLMLVGGLLTLLLSAKYGSGRYSARFQQHTPRVLSPPRFR